MKSLRIRNTCGSTNWRTFPLFGNYNHHGNPHHAFTLRDQTFNIAQPHSGFIKPRYVRSFLDAMEALGLYAPEGNAEQQSLNEDADVGDEK